MDFKKGFLIAGLCLIIGSQRPVANAQTSDDADFPNKKLAYNEVVKDFNSTFYHFATNAIKEKVSGTWIVPGFSYSQTGKFTEFNGFFGDQYLPTISFTLYDRQADEYASDKSKDRIQVLKCSAFLATKQKEFQVECDGLPVAGVGGYNDPITLTGKTLAGNLQEFKKHFFEEIQTLSNYDYENQVFTEDGR